jgi:hypothetical protein
MSRKTEKVIHDVDVQGQLDKSMVVSLANQLCAFKCSLLKLIELTG